ncbi:hypothetical protein DICPUDRAFT_47119 [Dictyostelium purpureum]|uniref:Uncharacterized protein n=1 Tax=Dictyostelium purpureum TaxID=5786 RepID=F0ZHW4_DICPU|nr:uncharacterized protein DICPUDRAFT_47119 [Dictyostelium purpureum]EGC36495.1 hypothetical protein DICPUDRAFT_47119 [Dictyostelium purpureum]|eukprot:XP_003287008.1 hypothetical protein DICPUDRAFT_47119 [Dictyostelium purpureum]
MSVFRDLVEGECAEPNAFGNFVQHLTNDRSELYGKYENHGKNELFNQFYNREEFNEQRHLDSVFDGEANEDDIHFMLDRNLNFNDVPREHHGELPLSNVASELQFFFQDFINSTKSGHLMQPTPLHHLPLTHSDKLKIKNRSNIMFKHFTNESEGFTEDQLNRMFESIGIDMEQDNFEDFDRYWEQPQQEQFHHHHPTTTTTTTTTSFEPFSHFDRQFEKDLPQDYQEEEEDFEKAWRDGARHEAELDQLEDEEDFDAIYDDPENFSPFDSAWHDAQDEYDQSVEAAWDETARKSINDITRPITQINDPKLNKSNFMKFMKQLNSGEATIIGDEVVHNPDFERVSGLSNDWAEEYANFQETIPEYRVQEYQFSINEARDSDTLERGMDLFNEGHLTDSIIALESEVKRNPENATAWMYLGIAHAENDQDGKAITCLLKSINIEPNNIKARLALAVSYTNDYQKESALSTLEEWLQRSPVYSNLYREFKGNADPDSFMDTWKHHEFTNNLFIEAARLRPNNPDPEVQTALGLLYNMSYEYDKAVDCFKAALQNSPEDYQLWNKLGATLANSNRSQEALGAYFKALEHKPSYVRARSNLGISYLSLNMFNEAASTFLGAIAIHPAQNIWDNLKMVFRLMNREDLVQKCDTRDVNQFLDEFKFM